MSPAVQRSQLVTVPDLPGRWSVWDKSDRPSSWHLVPANDAARDSRFTWATARFRSFGNDVLVQLLATGPSGRITVPGQYRDAEYDLKTGLPFKESGHPKGLAFARSSACRLEVHRCTPGSPNHPDPAVRDKLRARATARAR